MAALPYIQIYIADYKADTIGLTTLEHGAYLLLIFHYWQIGGPIKSELVRKVTQVDRRLSAKTTEVLKQFFDLRTHSDGVYWHHKRIDADLERVKSKSKQASKAGKQSGEARRKSNGRSTDNRTDVERTLNHTDTYTYTDTEADKPVAAVASLTVVDKPDNSPVIGLKNSEEKPKEPASVVELANPTKKPAIPNCPHEEIRVLYNEILHELPEKKPEFFDETDKRKLRDCWRKNKQFQNLDFWQRYFEHVRDNCDFYMGRTKDSDWTADFGFLTRPSKFKEIVENARKKKEMAEKNKGPCR